MTMLKGKLPAMDWTLLDYKTGSARQRHNIKDFLRHTLGEFSWGPQPSFNSQLFIWFGWNFVDISSNLLKSTRYMLPKSRGVFFLRSPKRRRQPPHRRTLLGDPETGHLDEMLTKFENFEHTFDENSTKCRRNLMSIRRNFDELWRIH